MDPDLRAYIDGMLKIEQAERTNMDDVKRHPWLRDSGESSLEAHCGSRADESMPSC